MDRDKQRKREYLSIKRIIIKPKYIDCYYTTIEFKKKKNLFYIKFRLIYFYKNNENIILV